MCMGSQKILRYSMSTRSLVAPLSAFGHPATQAEVVVKSLTLKDRLARAAVVAGAGLVVALIALPIPLVHFVLVPAALLLGMIFAAARLRHREIFATAEG